MYFFGICFLNPQIFRKIVLEKTNFIATMKFIKEIPNNYCKASLFAWNNKFIIKFEAGMYEQTYKVNEYDVSGEDEIEEMLGDTFMEKVIKRFKEMSEDFESILDSID